MGIYQKNGHRGPPIGGLGEASNNLGKIRIRLLGWCPDHPWEATKYLAHWGSAKFIKAYQAVSRDCMLGVLVAIPCQLFGATYVFRPMVLYHL